MIMIKVSLVILVLIAIWGWWTIFFGAIKLKKDELNRKYKQKIEENDLRYFGRIINNQTEKRLSYEVINEIGEVIFIYYAIVLKDFKPEKLKREMFNKKYFENGKSIVCRELDEVGNILNTYFI